MTRILIADDSSQVRRLLKILLEQVENWSVCGEAIDGRDAVERVKETNPDLIILDFQMPLMNGLQAAREISKFAPDIPVLLCTSHLSVNLITEAQRVGILGAVSKSDTSNILHGIRALLQHQSFYCQEV